MRAHTSLSQTTKLGSTDIKISRIGIGTNRWAFGENDEAVSQAYNSLLDRGINFFDTAEIYTGGRSERLLGACHNRDGRPAVIASKYMPSPTRTTGKHFAEALSESLSRLEVETLDLYYIHMPPTKQSVENLMDYMAEAHGAGRIRSVGVSNFDAEQMRRAAARLEGHGIPLAANEVEYSLMHREPEVNGVLEACRDLGVSLVAYRPLGRGVLASVEAATVSSKVSRGKSSVEDSVTEALRLIAGSLGRSVGQVALSWLLRRDEAVIPIPGATKVDHAMENAGALDWALGDAEFRELEEVSSPGI
jgi:aryl-alcohol dehydrogenase-like predicted oxidoreductase